MFTFNPAQRIAPWVVVHALPLIALPAITGALGPRLGLDAAAAMMHAGVLVILPLGQASLLERSGGFPAWWKARALAGLAAAFAVAMVLMSTIDLMGYDTAATPIAMGCAGLLQGAILGWPLRRFGLLGRWVGVSAAGWLVGTLGYRALLALGLAWEIGGRSAYGYAYTGGHNELLWMSAGLAGFGIATALLAMPPLTSARRP